MRLQSRTVCQGRIQEFEKGGATFPSLPLPNSASLLFPQLLPPLPSPPLLLEVGPLNPVREYRGAL